MTTLAQGADPQVLEAVAGRLRRAAGDLGKVRTASDQAVAVMKGAWGGADFQAQFGGWCREGSASLHDVQSRPQQLSRTLVRNAADQRKTSSADVPPPGGERYSSLLTAGRLAAGSLSSLWKLYSKGGYLARLAANGKLSRAAEARFLKLRAEYQALKGSHPDLSDPKVLNRYMALEKDMLKAYRGDIPGDVRAAQSDFKAPKSILGNERAAAQIAARTGLDASKVIPEAGRFGRMLAPLGKFGPLAGKVLGPLAVISGGYDLYKAFTGDGPLDDRIAQGVGGAAGVVGGGLMTAAAFGLVTLGPVGLAVVAGAGLVAAGAWVYENRKAIGHAISTGAHWVGHQLSNVGHTVSNVGHTVWHAVFG